LRTRGRTEILARLLSVATSGARKTAIMYGSNLSYSQLTEYLGFAENKRLIEFDAATKTYHTTVKGLTFIHAYEVISTIINEGEKPLT
jgi:predicted transcriptional regulator